MKNTTHIIPALATAAVFIAGFAGSASANRSTGSIDFRAAGVTTDNPILANATTFSVTGVAVNTDTGEYATLGAIVGTPVAFTGFTFNPPVASVNPLWTFDVGATVFSFDAQTISSGWVAGPNTGEWVIQGTGIASISGFSDTPGEFTVNLSQSGNAVIAFDSTAAGTPTPSVPDGGGTLTLLGCGVTALGLFARKFPC